LERTRYHSWKPLRGSIESSRIECNTCNPETHHAKHDPDSTRINPSGHQSSHTTRTGPKLPRTRRPREGKSGGNTLPRQESAALISGAYWLIVFPGLLIMLIILALTLITLAIERNLKVKE
jgi:hypothetical protein